jgi:hypothetical protein
MKKFKVISLYCPNGANKVFNSGDVVTEADFADGVWAEKLNRGFLELIGETEPPVQDPPKSEDNGEGVAKTGTDDQKSGEESTSSDLAETLKKTVESTDEVKTDENVEKVPHGTSDDQKTPVDEIKVKIDDISIKQIRDDLKKAGIPFDKDAAKEVLFELWQKRELTETI